MRSFQLKFFLALIILPSLFFPACSPAFQERIPPQAVKGVLDLTQWDFKRDGPIDLEGEYEFYWKRHLEPYDFVKSALPQKSGFIRVPGYWNNFIIGGKKLRGQGYATYRLRVLFRDQKNSLAIKFLSMGTAFKFYINGKELGAVGIAGMSRETTVPRYFPEVVDLEIEKNQLEIILHLSNFHHRRGGAWELIKLGEEEQIREIRERRLSFDLFLFGSILVMALYHIGLFVLRKKDRSPLYFGIFSFLIALRVLTTGERYFIHLFPNASWELMVKIEYLSIYLALPAFALFMQSIFSKEFSKRILRVIVILCLSLSCIVIFSPARIFTYTLPVSHLIIFTSFVYGIYVLIFSISRKRYGALVFLIGFLILSLATVNDIMHVEKIIQTGYFAPFGLFIFIFSQAFILSLRFSRALTTVEMQEKELRGTLEAYKKEIIDRVQADKALRESEEKYRTIIHSIEDGYYEVDIGGNLMFFNESLCHILGYPSNELMGMNNRCYMSEETAKTVYQTFNEVYLTGRSAKAFDWETITKDGARKYLETSVSMMWDSDGKPIGFRGVARDVTERKEAEEREKLHQQQLMQASKMVALGTLVSGVAHEINNPNNFIMLNTPLLMEAWQGARPILEDYYRENGDFVLGGMRYSEMRKNISKLFSGILDGSKRIKHIVDDLKNYVRKDTSDLKQPVNINTVIESAISLLSNMIRKSTDHFSIDYGSGLPEIEGNFQRLEQVMINLIQNACQALQDTGRGIFVATWVDKANCNVVVRVKDEGAGILTENLPHIGDPFFTTKHDSGGVGLGLSISSTIIEEHGGTITFTSEHGKGTTAEIRLPIDRVGKNSKKEVIK
jgi:PAS domain S-box-containing protein